LFRIHDHDNEYPLVVCMFCFRNPKKLLFDCIVGLHKNNVSNFTTHLEKKHKKEPLVKSLKLPSKNAENKAAAKVANSVCSKSTVHEQIMSGDINVTVDKFQEFWYKAIVSIGAASSTVENKDLRSLLEFTARNGSALWTRQNCFRMSRLRFTQLKYESFCRMIKNTQLFAEFCREFYRKNTNTNYTPFINVLHDCWTKSNAEIVGVSICFIDPKKFVLFRLAVGLQEVKTKNSVEIANVINNILGRINIVTEDIWRGINDNATAAKYVGRLISGGRIPLNSTSTCIMHSGNLVLEHALGTKIRTKNKHGFLVNTL
jgi:hypothetical protein